MTMSEAMKREVAEINFEKRAEQILSNEPILAAKDIEVQFTLRGQKLTAIRKCSLELYDGETLAIVGESGSGKSVFTKCFVGMLDKNGSITHGSIMYQGQDLAKFTTEKEWRTIRGKKIAMVTQDPMTSLNPLKRIGHQIQEAIELHQGLKGSAAKKEAMRMLEQVGIPDPERRYYQYPHEFSGGMRQRVVIAIAVACRPQILICDEPTTALDVTIQAQILDLIRKLQKEQGMTIIYITHDLGVVANVADRVAVMYAGQIVEIGMVNEIFSDVSRRFLDRLRPYSPCREVGPDFMSPNCAKQSVSPGISPQKERPCMGRSKKALIGLQMIFLTVGVQLAGIAIYEVIRQYLAPERLINAVIMHRRIVYKQLLSALQVRIGVRYCGKQRPGVRMHGMPEQFFRFRQLHNLSLMDHSDAVRNEAYHGQIVCNEQIRQAAFLLQFIEQVKHLRTDGHVKG